MDERVSNEPSIEALWMRQVLTEIGRQELPFYPVIMAFVTGPISADHCVPMKREPLPRLGDEFGPGIAALLEEAYRTNPSVHDGAIVFSRIDEAAPYRLSAWSMRIVSTATPIAPSSNHGSAYNSAHALSAAPNVDCCCIISRDLTVLFDHGNAVKF
jgi:hypothetical protein